MNKRYIITLTATEREQLLKGTKAGNVRVRQVAHAHILLKADTRDATAHWTDAQIGDAYQVQPNTVAEVRKRFGLVELDGALRRKPAGHRRRSLDGEAEAPLIALARSLAPEEREPWTSRLLPERMVELQYGERLSHATVRQTRKK